MKKPLITTALLGSITLSLHAAALDECKNAYDAGALDKAQTLCTKAVKDDSKSYMANYWLCKLYLDSGEYKKMLPVAQKLEKLAKTIVEYIGAYNMQGLAYSKLGDKKQELKYTLKALEAGRKIGDRGSIGTSLHNLGLYYSNIGNNTEAMKYFNEALEYTTDKVSLANTYNSLGVLYSNQSNIEKAIENYQKAVRLAKEGGDFVSSARCSVGLAGIYIESGKYSEARPLLDDALQIARDRGAKSVEAYALIWLGVWSARQGDKTTAKRYYIQALEIATATGYASNIADIKNLINELN